MTEFTFSDLFAGIGGFRLAAESLGGTCVATVEWDRAACETYSKNHEPVEPTDISEVERLPECDLICGGFPCQTFSKAGTRRGFEDPRGNMFFEMARLIDRGRPGLILLENVPEIIGHDNGRTFSVVLGTLEEIGYHVRHTVVNTVQWVPQLRRRVYIAGVRKGLAACPSVEVFAGLDYCREVLTPQVCLDGFEDTAPPDISARGMETILDDPVDPGMILTQAEWDMLVAHKERHQERENGFGCVLYPPSEPARTIASFYGNVPNFLVDRGLDAGNLPRRLSVQECRRAMGFPEGFLLPGVRQEAIKQLGNAVVPAATAAVMSRLLDAAGPALRWARRTA